MQDGRLVRVVKARATIKFTLNSKQIITDALIGCKNEVKPGKRGKSIVVKEEFNVLRFSKHIGVAYQLIIDASCIFVYKQILVLHRHTMIKAHNFMLHK